MSKTYKATGINLKAQPMGESDRIVTVLTKELGLIRAIAPGARKHKSSLGGRSDMFVVNELLIVTGRSLDRITQAQTIKTYPGLAKNLGKLAASQYLAEIVLHQALSDQPQTELYELLNQHLHRLENLPVGANGINVVAYLTQGLFDFLATAGLTPQVQFCNLTQSPLTPNFTKPNWQAGFSIPYGGIVCLEAHERLRKAKAREMWRKEEKNNLRLTPSTTRFDPEQVDDHQELPTISSRLNARELFILQNLSQTGIIPIDIAPNDHEWFSVEKILRKYIQYHFECSINSAKLIDSYFATNHDAIV
jgi:DNA repair protein RecO (recombination protein O)